MGRVELDEEKDVDLRVGQDETSQIKEGTTPQKADENFENIQQIVEEVIAKEMKTVDQKIRSAIKDALTEVFGEFLTNSGESTELETEEQPKCPANPKWLKAMFSILPEDVLKHSKLWKYRHCIKDFE